jgi:hypothetical protein
VVSSLPAVRDENPRLLGFIGSGRVVANRDALDFIVREVLSAPPLSEVRCRVIGDTTGYTIRSDRIEYVGFCPVIEDAIEPVSVFCAPMREARGMSTKSLLSLMSGKRTVCTPEAAEGIIRPESGIWVAERSLFAQAVEAALLTPWSSDHARQLRVFLSTSHGFPSVVQSWSEALPSDLREGIGRSLSAEGS